MKPFTFDFAEPHQPPQMTEGHWYVEDDGVSEIEIVNEMGEFVANIDLRGRVDDPSFWVDAQCIALVPELVRAIYVAGRALRGNLPENETETTIAEKLSALLKRCYSSPEEGGTIKG